MISEHNQYVLLIVRSVFVTFLAKPCLNAEYGIYLPQLGTKQFSALQRKTTQNICIKTQNVPKNLKSAFDSKTLQKFGGRLS